MRNIAIGAALKAGEKILEIYDRDFKIEIKDDSHSSPLTEADTAAHNVICEALKNTDIPILSEESKELEYADRENWSVFWLVDPLDGTKEFIKHNGEFTVNIALIENGKPTFGVVYAPVLDVLYVGDEILGAYKVIGASKSWDNIQEISCKEVGSKLEVIASRSHLNDKTKDFVSSISDDFDDVDFVSKGSSLKLCMVADGSADVYPRIAPTMEWDTAAAHAVVSAAGGHVLQFSSKAAIGIDHPLVYNKPDLLNPYFIVCSSDILAKISGYEFN